MHAQLRRFAFALVATMVALASLAAPAAQAETLPARIELLDIEPLLDGEWIDPVIAFDLDGDDLEPVPPFDASTLHNSTVLASGVDWVEVVDDPLPVADERIRRAMQAHATIERIIRDHGRELRSLRPEIDELNRDIAAERAQIGRLEAEIDLYTEAIIQFAVEAFIGEEELDTALSQPTTELSENVVLADDVREGQFAEIAAREAEIADRNEQIVRLRSQRQELRRRVAAVKNERARRIEHRRDANVLIERAKAGYVHTLHTRLTRPVVGTDFQLVALNAYVIAERVLAEEQPRCGLQWWMLAGTGKIESFHGQFDNGSLDIDGNTEKDIRGPALDGRILEGEEFLDENGELPPPSDKTETIELPVEGSGEDGAAPADGSEAAPVPVIKRLALIRDTDGGSLDGDRTYDRAVGPMQFIPQTWRLYEVDANGDGDPNPQNMYDATIAAGRYLCTATSTMTTEEGRERAYFAYNHDTEYTADVEAAAQRYRRSITLLADPRGNSSNDGLFGSPTPLLDEIARALSELALVDLPDW